LCWPGRTATCAGQQKLHVRARKDYMCEPKILSTACVGQRQLRVRPGLGRTARVDPRGLSLYVLPEDCMFGPRSDGMTTHGGQGTCQGGLHTMRAREDCMCQIGALRAAQEEMQTACAGPGRLHAQARNCTCSSGRSSRSGFGGTAARPSPRKRAQHAGWPCGSPLASAAGQRPSGCGH
jgi:hypothetical protein